MTKYKDWNLSLSELRESFRYDAETGNIFWRTSGGRRRSNVPAGSKRKDGYIKIGFAGKHYPAHRLAWILFYGKFADGEIDHIDRDRSNNRISNLRCVTRRENASNTSKSNKEVGTTFIPRIGKWQAQTSISGKYYYLGLFATSGEAASAYKDAVLEADQ